MRLFRRRSRPPRLVLARMRAAEAWAFDWDGTLLDSMSRTLAVYQQLFAEFGVAFDAAAFRAHYAPAWQDMYRRVGLARDRWDAADRRWTELYESEPSALTPGADEALRALQAQGLRLALVTSGQRARVELELRATGLAGMFATSVYGDAVPRQKPDPAPLMLAARYLRLDPSRLVYVGDAVDDMQMARAARALPVGVLTGASDRSHLKAAGAEWVAANVVAAAGALF